MMMMSQRFVAGFTAVAFAVALSGCASSGNPQPSVFAYPAKGQTSEQQARDSSECQTWAKGQSGWDPATDTAKGVGIGAAVGALGGAALGAAVGAAAGSQSGLRQRLRRLHERPRLHDQVARRKYLRPGAAAPRAAPGRLGIAARGPIH